MLCCCCQLVSLLVHVHTHLRRQNDTWAAMILSHRFLEQGECGGMVLAAGSLAVRHVGSATHMHIDHATAQALELIQPIRVGTCSAKLSGMSLFRWVLAALGAADSGKACWLLYAGQRWCTMMCRPSVCSTNCWRYTRCVQC